MSDLLNDLLAMPTGPAVQNAPRDEAGLTRALELSGSSLSATISGEPGSVTEGTAREYLESEGLDPEQWQVTGFRKSVWGDSERPMESVRFTYAPVSASQPADGLDIDAMVDRLREGHTARLMASSDDKAVGLVVALGDLQVGKVDGDGHMGTIERAYECLLRASEQAMEIHEARGVNHIHIAWLGDLVEGFESQGGKNVWRTPLGLNSQIRIVRRLMLEAVRLFAWAPRLTVTAVPGNHGRVAVNGALTTYDDSFDTEPLIAVADACALASDLFGHVEFYVPTHDEMTTVVDVNGVRIAHAHGHQWRPGKGLTWWQGQAFGNSHLRDADVLLCGHLHHLHAEQWGKRIMIQVPALELESTWWKHATGTTGDPGIVMLTIEDNTVSSIGLIRGNVEGNS